MRGARWISAAMLVAGWPAPARAEEGICHIVELDFTPAEISTPAAMRAPSQIVAWIEDPAGQLVETIFISQETGHLRPRQPARSLRLQQRAAVAVRAADHRVPGVGPSSRREWRTAVPRDRVPGRE